MKTTRKILAILLIIPVPLFVNSLVNPGASWLPDSTEGEMLYLVCGLPILMLNY